MNRWLRSYGAWVYRHATLIVVFALILSALSIVGASFFLKTQTGILDLYSETSETNRRFLTYSKKFGAVEYLILVFEGKNENARRNAMEKLAARLKPDPNGSIKDVFYKVDLGLFKSHAFQFLKPNQAEEIIKQARDPQGGIRELFAAADLNDFFASINRNLSAGMKKGGPVPADAAEQFAKLVQPLVLLNEYLDGKELDAELITNRLEAGPEEKSTLDEYGYLRTDDQQMHVMLIRPTDRKQDYKMAHKLVDWVRKEIDAIKGETPGVTIGVTGGPALNNDQFRISQRDMTLASIFAFATTAILFFLAFKSFMRPFFGLATLAITISWVFGFTTLTIGHLNLFSLAFVVILVGQGTYFGVHVVARYEEELQKGRSVQEAIEQTLSNIFGNVTTSAATTASAFFATTLVDMKGFAELGWIAGWGIVLSALAMQLVLPAFLVLYDRNRPRDKLILASRNRLAVTSPWAQSILRHIRAYSTGGAIVMLFLALGGAYLFFSPQYGIHFDNNLLNLQAKDTEAVRYEKKLIETNLSPRAGIYMTESLEEAGRIARTVKERPTVQRVEWLGDVFPQTQASADTQAKVRKAILALTPASLTPPDLDRLENTLTELKKNREMVQERALYIGQGDRIISSADQGIAAINGILKKFPGKLSDPATRKVVGEQMLGSEIAEFQTQFFAATREMLTSAAKAKTLSLSELPQEIRDRFVSPDGTYAVYVFPSVNIWEEAPLKSFVQDLRAVSPEATGPPIMFYEILRLVQQDYFRAAFYSAIAIFLIFLIDFRSLRYSLMATVPLVLGVFSMFGFMVLFGLNFNTANMIALPMILGIGADNGVHMIHRFREDGNVDFLFKSTGKALFVTFLDSISSFIGLAFANHQGLAQLGKVSLLGITTCTVAGFLFLPAVMILVMRYRASRALAPNPA